MSNYRRPRMIEPVFGNPANRLTLRPIFLLFLMLSLSSVARSSDQQRFVVDIERSWIRVLVYRAGLFSGLGHNHVISSNDVSGTVERNGEIVDTAVELSFPVESLVVDDAKLRDTEGDDFPGHLSEKDIQGTRKNMLGRKVLDANNHPVIRIKSTAISGEIDLLTVKADMTVAGQTNSITFPASANFAGNEIIISGSAQISHKDLGLKSFSAVFGTLKVNQDMTVRFEITAVPDTARE